MTASHGSRRWITRTTLVAGICTLGWLGSPGSAAADPYPPLPPIGQVPAIATVPAPGIVDPVAPGFRMNAGTTVIAPGSYPVQARTGAGPTADEPGGDIALAAVAALAGGGVLGIGVIAAAKSGRTRRSS
ncbi:hypothetical protein [Williamsia phyllosphaerae]|uniref:Uncharacterized protein n=1 Tax=Williamsia phyllosphaerae TaxID=885042 RepID=A0ABQ1UP58_9NOCA|nr:hypothetical protein [Williamsia phyllosphaerae]GGF22877.1 hypothetical protein GCM10007298_18540 [Williamsia phyllosphaerae]